MGYGVPAAIAAKLLHPERIVIAAAGDGDFLMTGQELATAVQFNAAIVVLVFDILGHLRLLCPKSWDYICHNITQRYKYGRKYC